MAARNLKSGAQLEFSVNLLHSVAFRITIYEKLTYTLALKIPSSVKSGAAVSRDRQAPLNRRRLLPRILASTSTMSEDNKDLLRFAAEYADKDTDLYELLGVDALTSKEDIHRAWRKRSLKYHPDKAGDNFDAATWEKFERARDILCDATARAAYDAATKAKLLRKQERDAMDREHKKFADDLEARENAARRVRQEREQKDREVLQKERERLAETQRMRDDETRRQAEAAQEMEDLAEARRRLKEKKDEKSRRRQAKESFKAASAAAMGSVAGAHSYKGSGPVNGAVDVPGDYVADASVNKKYWELVCDKLTAVQALRNLQRHHGAVDEELQRAQQAVDDARVCIQNAEVKYQRETPAARI